MNDPLSAGIVNRVALGYESFQLFGFHFVVDTKFHVWLLALNDPPACA